MALLNILDIGPAAGGSKEFVLMVNTVCAATVCNTSLSQWKHLKRTVEKSFDGQYNSVHIGYHSSVTICTICTVK